MSRFEYLTTFVTIILGLGLADLLQSAYRLVQARRRVRFHWLPLTWGFFVFLLVVLFFWSFYEFGAHARWGNFFPFLFLLVSPILLFLASANALPDELPREAPFDLKAFYYERPRGFFVILSATLLCFLANSLLVGERMLGGRQLMLASGAVLFVVLAWRREEAVHTAVTGMACVLLLACVLFYALPID